MLTAPDLGFRRRAENGNHWPAPAVWEDPVFRGVTALAVASLLVPVLVVAILAAALLTMPFSGSLPEERPGIESRITRVFDSTGAEIANYRRFETSLPIAKSDIPPVLIDAVLAVEDQRFYEHKGVDSRGIFRALWADIQGGGYVEGGSDHHPAVRPPGLPQRRTHRRPQAAGGDPRRPDREEAEQGRDPVRYLSRAYFGSGAYGVGAAAETYFNKRVKDLNLTEAAMIAGMLSAPSLYDPRTNPGEAEYQRQRVIGKMADQGRITPVQYNEALPLRVTLADNRPKAGAAPATVVQPAKAPPSKYPWFTDYVRGYLIARYGEEKVYSGGLRVEVSIDPGLQRQGGGVGRRDPEGHRGATRYGAGVPRPQDGPGQGHGGGPGLRQVPGQPGPGQLPGAKAPPGRRRGEAGAGRRPDLCGRRWQRPPARFRRSSPSPWPRRSKTA